MSCACGGSKWSPKDNHTLIPAICKCDLVWEERFLQTDGVKRLKTRAFPGGPQVNYKCPGGGVFSCDGATVGTWPTPEAGGGEVPSPSPPRSAAPPTPSFWPGHTDSVFPASRWCKENLRRLKVRFLVLRSIGHRKLIPGSGRQAPADNHNLESTEVSDPQLSAKRVTPVRSVCGCGRQPGSGRRRVSLHVPRLGGSTRVARRAPQPSLAVTPRRSESRHMDAFARRDSLTEWSSLLSRTSPGAQAWTRSLGVRLPSSARPGPPPACQGDRPTPPTPQRAGSGAELGRRKPASLVGIPIKGSRSHPCPQTRHRGSSRRERRVTRVR